MEPFRDDDPIAELAALRPAPRPAFAAELDERAAAGFPRRSPPARLAARLRSIQPRRVLIPAGATALAAIAAVTVVVALNEPRSQREPGSQSNLLGRLSEDPDSAGIARQAQPLAAGGSSGGEYSAIPPVESGPYAAKTARREIERSAQIVLGADAADVSKDAARVFEAVHAHDGIVLRSSVRDGDEGEAGASFDLLIPSAKLSDALASFSAIAEVRSRHEATADITAPTVRTGELVRDSRAKIDSLLAQLAQADTDAERTVTEAELRAERRHNAHLRSQLSTLERRASFSRVSLRIETAAAPSPSDGEDGGWGVGDAFGAAGHILAIAAGVVIVGLAVIGPLALIALLAWLVNRALVRRGRERALE